MGLLDSKILAIDTVSQNWLNTIDSPRQSLRSWQVPKIGLVVKKFVIYFDKIGRKTQSSVHIGLRKTKILKQFS